jgi:hypothetical protein
VIEGPGKAPETAVRIANLNIDFRKRGQQNKSQVCYSVRVDVRFETLELLYFVHMTFTYDRLIRAIIILAVLFKTHANNNHLIR